MASKRLIFALIVVSIFTITHTSLLGGALKILGLDVILPCQFMIDIILFIFRSTAAFTLMLETAVDNGKQMIEMVAIPISILTQNYYNSVLTAIPALLGQSTDDECFRNMTKKYQEIITFKPNGTYYTAGYLETLKEFREALTEGRVSGQAYFDRYSVCKKCDCLPIMIESVTEWLVKLGPLIAKNWVIDMSAAIFNTAHQFLTDFNVYMEEVAIGIHNMIFEYQRCVGNKL